MFASFVCSTSGCYASISLRVLDNEIKEPYEISHLNENHKNNYIPRTDSYFDVRDFMKTVKTPQHKTTQPKPHNKFMKKPKLPIGQIQTPH